jgi:acid phosphatase class B
MTTNFIYKNPPNSGLGDRLLDIITLYAYSKFLNYDNFYVCWCEKNLYTRPCLKLTYLLNYIEFPNNIHFVSIQEIDNLCKNSKNFIFNDILSATSLFLFQKKYINQDNFETFKQIYFNSFNSIKLINIPYEVQNIFEQNKNIITIHLRRTDKVNNDPGAHGVNNDELTYLNLKTKEYIYQKINNNNTICFISDDEKVKNEYINIYNKIPNVNILYFNNNNDAIQTYIDYYCLVNSKEIFMSQKFSTFSITSSLIKNAKLYYCFNYGRLFEYENIQYCFNKYSNIIMIE